MKPQTALTALFQGEDQAEFLAFVRTAVEANAATSERYFGTNRWRSPAFEFTRRVKAHPKLERLSGFKAGTVLNLALRELYPDTNEELLWRALIGHTDTEGTQIDAFSDFLACWAVVSPYGEGKLAEVVMQMDEAGPRPAEYFGAEIAGKRYELFRRFLTLCEERSKQLEEGQPIVLSETAWAEALATSPFQISRWRRMAVDFGFLKLAKEHSRGHAAEFFFHLPPVPPG